MRLFMLEMKRLVKTRRYFDFSFYSVGVFSDYGLFAVSFESINRPGEDGSIVELDGLEAFNLRKIITEQLTVKSHRKEWQRL